MESVRYKSGPNYHIAIVLSRKMMVKVLVLAVVLAMSFMGALGCLRGGNRSGGNRSGGRYRCPGSPSFHQSNTINSAKF